MLLKHTQADSAASVKPYIAPLCLSGVCHGKVSEIRSTANVASKMTKVARYLTEDNHDQPSAWLADSCSGYLAALRFLKHTRPGAAEMVHLLLTGSTFAMSCYRKEVSVPNSDDPEDASYALFENDLKAENHPGTTFAQHLRTHNTTVNPPRRYVRLRGKALALAVEMTSPFGATTPNG